MYREPDASQNADPAEIDAALFGQTEREASGQPLRFSLWQLLTVTTLAAALLALFRALGIWGAVFAFAVAAVCSLTAYRSDRQRQALLFDFIWGLVMPSHPSTTGAPTCEPRDWIWYDMYLNA